MLIRAAEQYYRLMIRDDVSSWNLRDRHMAETIAHIRQHLIDHSEKPKLIVWAHNSHVGDARATEMSKRGEFNIGQVTKELYATDCISLGFTTYEGTVTAASNWDGAAERKKVRLALDETYEKLFHEIGLPRFYLGLEKHRESTRILREPRLERAIGVIYRPDSERMSHYFFASLAEQFDAIIHIDRTRAVAPIEHQTHWDLGTEAPESYPTGL
ncbi:MAG: erythromycin esterase family protein, partial [Proteobacteria bacterium]|nr:erythromycin esterase family protein [Pseudomonadota bacterium]